METKIKIDNWFNEKKLQAEYESCKELTEKMKYTMEHPFINKKFISSINGNAFARYGPAKLYNVNCNEFKSFIKNINDTKPKISIEISDGTILNNETNFTFRNQNKSVTHIIPNVTYNTINFELI